MFFFFFFLHLRARESSFQRGSITIRDKRGGERGRPLARKGQRALWRRWKRRERLVYLRSPRVNAPRGPVTSPWVCVCVGGGGSG